jgi:hypothetical protein
MRILVTGSRKFTDLGVVGDWLEAAVAAALREGGGPAAVTVVHGDCDTGADRMADQYARAAGWTVETHPADWTMGPQIGHWRNQHMVNLGADLALVFFQRGADNAGTKDCLRRIKEAEIRHWIYPVYPELVTS